MRSKPSHALVNAFSLSFLTLVFPFDAGLGVYGFSCLFHVFCFPCGSSIQIYIHAGVWVYNARFDGKFRWVDAMNMF